MRQRHQPEKGWATSRQILAMAMALMWLRCASPGRTDSPAWSRDERAVLRYVEEAANLSMIMALDCVRFLARKKLTCETD